MPGIFYTLGLNSRPLSAGLAAASSALRGFAGSVGSLAGLSGGLIGTTGAVMGLKHALAQASGAEQLQLVMARLLKDGIAAKKMVADLTKFADVTPFEPGPVQEAGKQLLAYGVAAKEVIPILTDLGDFAAGMNRPLEEAVSAFGRLKAGDFGQAFESLRNMNIGRDQLMAAGLKFDAGGSFQGSARQAMDAVRSIMRDRFGGGMEDLSRSSAGLFSTLKGNFDALFREFGTPLNQALKPMLTEASAALATMTPLAKQLGENFAAALGSARELFQSGQMGEALSLSLKIGFGEAVNYGAGLLRGVVQATGVTLAAAVQSNMEGLRAMARPNYWIGIGLSLASAAENFSAIMLDGVAEVARGMSRVKGFGFMGESADLLDGGASKARENAAALKRDADTYMLETTDAFGNIRKGLGAKFKDAFQESIKSMELVNLDGMREKFSAMFVGAASDAQAGIAGKLQPDEEFNPRVSKPLRAQVSAAFDKMPKVDKLAQIGAFVGRQGGPQGQRAAEETAKNTKGLVPAVRRVSMAVERLELGRFATE